LTEALRLALAGRTMPPASETIDMQIENGFRMGAQGSGRISDVGMSPMSQHVKANSLASASHDGRRTVLALVSASIISLVVWGLVVVLNVH
jgi:hypothetical protein